MANTRELSQFASLIHIIDENKSIGLVTSYPNANIGIGTLVPTSKVDVVGDVNVSGVITATSFYGDGSNLTGLSLSSSNTGNFTGVVTALTFETTVGSYLNFYAGHAAGSSDTGSTYNTGVGLNVLQNLSGGDYNTVFGSNSGQNLTTGYQNTIIGSNAGDTLTTGFQNVLIGINAGGGLSNSGIRNTFVGSDAGRLSFNGDYSTILGYRSGYDCEGDYAITIGTYAGYALNGNGTICVGSYSGYNSDYSSYSIMMGYRAGYYLEGDYNIALGYDAMYSHDNGGDYNIAIGFRAKYYDSADSNYNIAIGYRALTGDASNTNGDYNIVLGYQSGYNLQDGSDNLLLGNEAGDSITSGSSNVVIVGGRSNTVDVTDPTANGQLVIGYGSTAWITANDINEVTIAGVTTVYGSSGDIVTSGNLSAVDFNSTSDINLKENIEIIENPIEKVLQLNGITFNWKSSHQSSAGVIAQDVEKILPEIVRKTDGKMSVNYNGLIGLLVEALKEQQQQINILIEKINESEK